MEPPKTTRESIVVPRRSHNRVPKDEPEIKETPCASSSKLGFPRDYISPRKDDFPLITLKKNPYYKLVTPKIP
jgi:hypothetical protein